MTQQTQEAQQNVLTPEQAMARQKQKIDYFMKKKNLTHLQDKVLDKLAKLEMVMEKDGVSFEDLLRGRGTEDSLKLFDDLNKSKIVVEGVLAHQLVKSRDSGELQQIEKESEGYISKVERKQTSDKEIAEALEKYQNNPTRENELEYFKKSTLTREERLEAQEEQRIRETEESFKRIQEKVINDVARDEAHKKVQFLKIQREETSHQARIDEALNDPRIKKVPTKVENSLNAEIEAKTNEIIEKEYGKQYLE